MRLLFWIIAVPLLALAGAFAAANHEPVTLRLWPFPYELVLPTYIAVLGAFLLGVLITALWAWLGSLPSHFERRRLARHEKTLEDETRRLREELEEARRAAAGGGAGETEDEHRRRLLVAGGD